MTVLLVNKPYRVLCRFSDPAGRASLADHVDWPGVYPAGRLDFDSEGLVVLTDDGALQHRIADPAHKLAKVYWVQVDGVVSDRGLEALAQGIELRDGWTGPATASRIEPPELWARDPPIRVRRNLPTSWVEIILREGRNRQVRRMTAAVGAPTLRLIRVAVGPWGLDGLAPGAWRQAPPETVTGLELPQGRRRRGGGDLRGRPSPRGARGRSRTKQGGR